MLLSLSAPVYAQEPLPEFYSRSITEDLRDNTDVLHDIEEELNVQMSSIMKMNGILQEDILYSRSTTDAVKVAVIESANTSEILKQLQLAQKLVALKAEKNTEDIMSNNSLTYRWRVPVIETRTQYGYATVNVSDIDDVVIFSTITSQKNVSNVSYLFDCTLLTNIFKESTLDIDIRTVLPISLNIISTDILLFQADGQSYGIPFSTRPDLLGVENGKIYSYRQIESKIQSLLTELSSNISESTLPMGSGITQSVSDVEISDSAKSSPLIFPVILLLLAVSIVGFYFHRKRFSH